MFIPLINQANFQFRILLQINGVRKLDRRYFAFITMANGGELYVVGQ